MDDAAVRERLEAERRATMARIKAMTTDYDEIVSAARDSNIDDEHDPEGSTVAFERAQVASLVTVALGYLEDLDEALARLSAGTYPVCAGCGGHIAPERLAARPTAKTCIRCAASPS